MSRDVQREVAVELGFPEKVVSRALKKYKFKTAGDLVDYLEMHPVEFSMDEEVEEEPAPGEEKITIVGFPAEADDEVVHSSSSSISSTAKPREKTLLEETEDLYRRSVCQGCFSRKRCFVTLPCSHFAICELCEKRLRKCPLSDCQEKIECSIQTYI